MPGKSEDATCSSMCVLWHVHRNVSDTLCLRHERPGHCSWVGKRADLATHLAAVVVSHFDCTVASTSGRTCCSAASTTVARSLMRRKPASPEACSRAESKRLTTTAARLVARSAWALTRAGPMAARYRGGRVPAMVMKSLSTRMRSLRANSFHRLPFVSLLRRMQNGLQRARCGNQQRRF